MADQRSLSARSLDRLLTTLVYAVPWLLFVSSFLRHAGQTRTREMSIIGHNLAGSQPELGFVAHDYYDR